MNQQEPLFLHNAEIIVDNFAGGGGASTGLEAALGVPVDIAINHDPEAVAMHAANHPRTKHFCEDVWTIDPLEATQGQPVALAWFSPDCKHFSKAKGGKPVNKKIRGLAWIVIKWAKLVKPRVIMLENVEEFETWGPLLENGMPDKTKTGFTFRRWWKQLENLGYKVELKVLRACDYGAPTSRKRLFIVARCDGQPIVWPQPTHAKDGKGGLKPWRPAAECIDWSIPCPSIFDRKKPLAENTMNRIARGLKRYVLDAAEPFIVNLTHGGRVEGLDQPLNTVTGAKRGEKALVTPYVVNVANGKTTGRGPNTWPATEPVRTITSSNGQAIVAASLIEAAHGELSPAGVQRWGNGIPDIQAPMGTVTASGGNHALVSAFMVMHYGEQFSGRKATDMREPLATVVGCNTQNQLVTSHLVKFRGTNTGQSVDEPLATISAQGTHHAEVRAFLIKYFGTDQDPRLGEPMHTVTSKDRFGLVTIHGNDYEIVDIGMRMLAPRELYKAQGFPEDYIIDFSVKGKPLTKTAQVRMCGNSVCPPLSEALARANCVPAKLESKAA